MDLVIRWGDMLFTLITFIILFFLLRKYAFGRIMSVMEERANKIEDDLSTAEKNRAEAEKYLEEQRKELEQARNDASQILENARVTSEKQAERIVREAKEETEQFKVVARKEIEREKEQAIEALRAELGQLTVQLASKVLSKEIDPEKQAQLIEDYLSEVGNRKWVQ